MTGRTVITDHAPMLSNPEVKFYGKQKDLWYALGNVACWGELNRVLLTERP